MLFQFWKNPEFIRHRRSELRPSRATAVGLVVLMVCVLTILACWANEKSRRSYTSQSIVIVEQPAPGGDLQQSPQSNSRTIHESSPQAIPDTISINTSRNAYRGLLLMQFGVLTFWSLLSCTQAVSRERERGTWDFQRTTRLTSAELLIGKLLGEPALAYFIVLCSLPITLAVGLVGRIGILNILSAYVVLLSSALFIGLAGLWLSGLFENKSRGIGLIGAFLMYGLFLLAQTLTQSPFPGLAAFSPLVTLLPLVGAGRVATAPPTIFGGQVPGLLMTLLLYITFGAWFVVMLVRNLKRDFREVRLLSRWQAVACCAFLNFVFYSLFNPRNGQLNNANDFVMFMIGINGFILFALGLAILSTPERLEITGFTSVRSSFSENGLQWPWLALSAAVSYFLLVWGLFAWGRVLGFSARTLEMAAVDLFIILIFVTRDVLFIQWCKMTRLRAPLIKGLLYLGLYYASVAVLSAVITVSSERAATATAYVLTPAAAFNPENTLLPLSALCGIVVQLMAIAFLIASIRGRLQRTALIAVAAAR